MSYAATATAGTAVTYKHLTPAPAGSATTISGVEDISVSAGSKTEIDVTPLSATAAVFIGGQPDYGELTITYFHDPADTGQALLLADAGTANTTGELTVTMSDGGAAVLVYTGYLHGWAPSWPKGGANMCSVKMKLSGAPSMTP